MSDENTNWVQGLTADIVPKLILACIFGVSGTAAYQLKQLNTKMDTVVVDQALGDLKSVQLAERINGVERRLTGIDGEMVSRTKDRFTTADAEKAFNKVTGHMEAAFRRMDKILDDHETRIRRNEQGRFNRQGGGGR